MIRIIDEELKLEYSQELLDMLQPGNVAEVFYNEDNINNQFRHIRAIIDEEYIVYRVQTRKGWAYKIAWLYEFHLLFEDAFLSLFEEEGA